MFGLIVNEMSAFYVDKITFKPLNCIKETPRTLMLYKPP
jgi:hypothetical protein